MKRAILNVAETGPLESTAKMLESIGYRCYRPDNTLIRVLRNAGLENVLSVGDMMSQWGYDRPTVQTTVLNTEDCDLFVDTKGHLNCEKITRWWPNLKGKVLWLCINGGDPRKRDNPSLWYNPPCPVLSHNQWYEPLYKSYTCFPPYVRFDQHQRVGGNGSPLCLVHNVERWGYGHLVQPLREFGVKFYGTNSPDGLISNEHANSLLANAACMVHLKAGDACSYAVMQAIASKCPVLCTQQYIDDCRLGGLLVGGETCLVFNEEDAVTGNIMRYTQLSANIVAANAYNHLRELIWKDVDGFSAFINRNFPC